MAPQANAGARLRSVAGCYAIAVHPYLERVTDRPADRQQMLSMIRALHAATLTVASLATVGVSS